ncbi:hypothetical protein DICPUDRAFT_87819 [Dictyostelium purpureum]|uniref:Short-chain dehydrogenase/reductase SDR n=1 Tax=Dictyostelium purpureum TaxID=5786 RepID=F0ZKK6_DICPU|nr:uncharacterized protein DICPUDRAFT_87819 [Dictyostelium purpureum]EGC35528.1 hypothetical protein DICPUDRAFT_87819 [Dictyostelium purpureum]|eukprot:XP_003287954.1 hypothetical protein DICPUDRAFT_87819 [Dictyostelium purpureum]
MTSQKERKVFFVSGASKGLGLILTKQILERGFNCASTSRNKEQLVKNLKEYSFVTNENFLPLEVDLSSDESIKKSIDETIAKFGRIDVVINNAGYSQCGTVEELTDKEVRDQFECNVFGVIGIIRNAAPYLRKNKKFPEGPRIINITSVGGFTGNFPTFSVYCSTKFAIEGLSEGLAADLKEFNVHVSTVLLGYFRTSFLEKGSVSVPSHPINEYTAVRKAQEMHQNSINGKQLGDPEKGAKAIIDFSLKQNPELHFFVGSDSIKIAEETIERLKGDIKANIEASMSTDHKN